MADFLLIFLGKTMGKETTWNEWPWIWTGKSNYSLHTCFNISHCKHHETPWILEAIYRTRYEIIVGNLCNSSSSHECSIAEVYHVPKLQTLHINSQHNFSFLPYDKILFIHKTYGVTLNILLSFTDLASKFGFH